jgi:hypothetical protein
MGIILFHNVTQRSDQLVVYVFKFLNREKHNYSTIKREALVLVFALHKFKHYLLGNNFFFYLDVRPLFVPLPPVLWGDYTWKYISYWVKETKYKWISRR